MREYFYYLRDEENKPVITVCLLTHIDTTARGISICSLQDMSCKKTGRAIARGRALKAFKRILPGDPVLRTEAWAVVATLCRDANIARKGLMISMSKYTFNPVLTDYEKKLLNF